MYMYQTAIIGLGNIGFRYDLDKKRKGVAGEGTKTHVSAYDKCPNTQLVGVVETDKMAGLSFSELYPQIPVYNSIEQFMANHRIDFVSICTPSENHYDTLKGLIPYPVKGVLCEKPIASTLNQAKEMVAICEEKGVLLTVNHGRRWHGAYLLAKGLIEGGEIGEIKAVTALYSGEVFNIGTHLFDTIRMLICREPETLSAVYCRSSIEKNDPSLSAWMEFEGGAHCTVVATGVREDLVFEIDLIGSEGRIKILNNGEKIEWYVFQDSSIYSGFREPYMKNLSSAKMEDVLLEAVKENIRVFEGKRENPACSGYDGLKALEMSYLLNQSAQMGGKPIKI